MPTLQHDHDHERWRRRREGEGEGLCGLLHGGRGGARLPRPAPLRGQACRLPPRGSWDGTSPDNCGFFDLEFYMIVLFDQKGAGRALPMLCLEENTTWDLVADIEKVKQQIDIPE
ncbi:proline iminopeptidase-like [Triticum dicoccoides]|uniref:proline iminopeptidase-like n=1 Tax=Triticum dicoccoides TaxID=85692 RepID=UPI00188F0098|nr:proline iminopeptidase-like [Triticum dicoccoides]